MIKRTLAVALIAVMATGAAHAGSACELSFRPATSGFFLNPVIDKLTVAEARSPDPERPCLLMDDDELLQINEQVIPGSRARALMKFWEGVRSDTGVIFKVRREGATISLVMD